MHNLACKPVQIAGWTSLQEKATVKTDLRDEMQRSGTEAQGGQVAQALLYSAETYLLGNHGSLTESSHAAARWMRRRTLMTVRMLSHRSGTVLCQGLQIRLRMEMKAAVCKLDMMSHQGTRSNSLS